MGSRCRVGRGALGGRARAAGVVADRPTTRRQTPGFGKERVGVGLGGGLGGGVGGVGGGWRAVGGGGGGGGGEGGDMQQRKQLHRAIITSSTKGGMRRS